MKKTVLVGAFAILLFTSCSDNTNPKSEVINNTTEQAHTDSINAKSGYSEVNGIKMYYEIYGQGKPLVLIHGGGSTIETSFGRIIPQLAKNRQVIALELQAHGRTGDRNTEISFEQDADDVAALLKNLNIEKADIFGFSNGANTALKMGILYPESCNKIIAASVLLKRDGAVPMFWKYMESGTFEQMPQQYKDAFMKVNPDSSKLRNMFQKCANRMNSFKDFSDEELKSIKSKVLLINGDDDVATPEHVVAMYKLIRNTKLAIIPGGHGAYIGEITTLKNDYKESDFIVPIIENFLN